MTPMQSSLFQVKERVFSHQCLYKVPSNFVVGEDILRYLVDVDMHTVESAMEIQVGINVVAPKGSNLM